MARMSIATIDKPEFINVTPCNPLISQCEIKVMYIGENRNKSYITKEVATQMANTLPGCPIVGYYNEDIGDFRDHGDMVTIDHEGIHFECLTRPYGFVAPDAKVWFQKFEDTDEFGNTVTREYLMTVGYLWTGQYPECQKAVENGGRPHSMELDRDTVDGRWATNQKTGLDFFIINDAIFSKLCILGEDVEPCFEGSSITAPDISTSFTVDEGFRETLYNMMQELKFALKGEQNNMVNEKDKDIIQSSFAESEEEKLDFAQEKEEEEKEVEVKAELETSEEENEEEKYQKCGAKDDEEKKKYMKEEDKDDKSAEGENEEDEEKKKYSLLEEEFNLLQEKYSNLESQFNELLAFKNQIEDEKKDELINSFYMLSDEDKQEVINNKSQYSLEDIEAKLSVICVRKKVNFDLDNTSNFEENKKEESVITTFNLDSEVTSTPAWVSAVRNTQNSRNI